MSEFGRYFQAVVDGAELEARSDGSATIEAQHMLLAIAGQDDTDAQGVLDSAGLDYEALKSALRREFEHSLRTAGVSLDAFDLQAATRDPSRRPQLGASFKLAMERMAAAANRRKDMRSVHLLLGVLKAEVGTVPRALALAGVDRADLVERVRSKL
jgi:ATP-dependent Clp protease ATP-binding subunit ClpA